MILCFEKYKNILFNRFGNAVTTCNFFSQAKISDLSEKSVNTFASEYSSFSIISWKTFSTHQGIIRQFTKAFFIYLSDNILNPFWYYRKDWKKQYFVVEMYSKNCIMILWVFCSAFLLLNLNYGWRTKRRSKNRFE